MSDQPDLPTPDGFDTSDAFEAALTGALEHRAGGPFASTATTGDDRLASIEAAVAAGGANQRRTVTLLATAAAVTVALFVSIAVARGSDDGNEVQSVGGGTTSSTSAVPTTRATGPGTTGPEAGTSVPPPDDIRNVDLRNFTYPSSICPEWLRPTEPAFVLVDGEGSLPNPWHDGMGSRYDLVLLPDVFYGDVTGDGVDDAVALMKCALYQSDGVKDAAVVVSNVDGVPTVIGSLPTSGTAMTGLLHRADGTVIDAAWEFVDARFAVDGKLRIRWLQTDGPMGYQTASTRKVTVTYLWDGTTFVPVGQSDVEVFPPGVDPTPPTTPPSPPSTPAPTPTDPPAPSTTTTAPAIDQSIRSVDLRSITLPLSHEGRVTWQAACWWRFADLPVTDTTLVDGSAVIRDGAGNPLDAAVSLRGEVQYTELTGDSVEEAVVRIGCRNGAVTRDNFVVLGWRNGAIVFLDSLQGFPGAVEFSNAVSALAMPGMTGGEGPPTLPNQLFVTFEYPGTGYSPLSVGFYWLPSECRFSHGTRPAGLDYTLPCS